MQNMSLFVVFVYPRICFSEASLTSAAMNDINLYNIYVYSMFKILKFISILSILCLKIDFPGRTLKLFYLGIKECV